VGNFIELVFHRFFLGMIATAYFWLLTLAGGVVFGIAPASATIMSLFAEHGYSYRAYGFKEAWTLYKSNFIKSNLSFYTFMGLDLILIYGLYLMIQLHFDLSYQNTLKLAFIGIFMSLSAVIKVLLGSVLLAIIGFYMPALIIFVGIGMWHFFISDLLEPVYESIHEKLASK